MKLSIAALGLTASAEAIRTQGKVSSMVGDDTILLSQADFASGTFITESGKSYKLTEDIVFDPNPENDSWPQCDLTAPGFQPVYCEGESARAYRLGFFAAVALTGDGVTFDLGGFEIKQSVRHNLQQRFYANIELAEQPFPPNAGPQSCAAPEDAFPLENDANEGCPSCKFGCEINGATNSVIKNGKLGLSSHHGIHGNNALDVVMEDLDIYDFEVAGISLNKCDGSVIKDSKIRDQRQDIPVRATYSAGRFMLKFVTFLLEKYSGSLSAEASADLTAKTGALKALMDDTLAQVMATNTLTGEALRQFGTHSPIAPVIAGSDGADYSATRLIDGNSYGIAFHNAGPLVGQFETNRKASLIENVVVENVEITNIVANVNEIVSLSKYGGGGAEADVAGGTVRIEEISTVNAGGAITYVPDALHDLRFALAWWSSPAGGNDVTLQEGKGLGYFGTFSISKETADWARNGAVFPHPAETFVCNMDSMNHRQKGVVGLFGQQMKNATFTNVKINGVVNVGETGSDLCGPYRHALNPGSSTSRTDNIGYTGSQARGVGITTSQGVTLDTVSVDGVLSQNSHAYGIEIFNNVDTVSMTDVTATQPTVTEENHRADKQPREQNIVLGHGVNGVTMSGGDFA